MTEALDFSSMERDGRLLAIRKLKRSLYRIQAGAVLVFSLLLLFVGNGFDTSPIFIGVETFLYFLLIMGLLVAIEGFVFRWLEIKLARSRTGRFFMLRKAQRKAVLISLVSTLVLLVFLVPGAAGAVEGQIGSEGTVAPTASFHNKDVLGLASVTEVTVVASEDVEVYIVTAEVWGEYGLNNEQLQANKLNIEHEIGAEDGSVVIPIGDMERTELYLAVMEGSSGASADFDIAAELSPLFKTAVPILAFLYAAAHFAYAAWLVPKRIKFARPV